MGGSSGRRPGRNIGAGAPSTAQSPVWSFRRKSLEPSSRRSLTLSYSIRCRTVRTSTSTRRLKELILRHADGGERLCLISGTAVRSGQNALILITYLDITARKQAERSLQELNQTLEARVENRTAELAAAMQRLEQTNAELTATLTTLQRTQDEPSRVQLDRPHRGW